MTEQKDNKTLNQRHYKAFLLYTVLFLLITAGIYYLLFQLQFGPYESTEYWLRDAYWIKRHIADHTKGQKILIVGGSNGLFGIDSAMITEKTGIPTVNMTLHAGLSPGFLLDPAKYPLNDGDMVIVPMEFDYYYFEKDFNNLTVEAVLTWDHDFFQRLPLSQKITFIRSCSPLRTATILFQKYYRRTPYHGITYEQVLTAARIAWAKQKNGQADANRHLNIYQRISRLGDVVGNKGNPTRIKRGIYSGLDQEDRRITEYAEKRITAFVRHCRERNARVFFTWPCTMRWEQFHYQNPVIRANTEKLDAFITGLGVPMLGKPDDFLFGERYFYDTGYHLNEKGREIRTRRLMEFFLEAIEKKPVN